MYTFLHNLLADKKGGEIFTLFSFWHFSFIFLSALAVAIAIVLLRKHSEKKRIKVTRVLGDTAFGLYLLDFFLMPLAYGEIDIEKLPFHACTASCVMCFIASRVSFLQKYRGPFILLALISNTVYLIYPAGVMWHAVHPLSYRVIQTLIFHSLMTVFGILSLVYENELFNFKTWHRNLTATVSLTLWALLGNFIYNGESDGYAHFFNWFFVVHDPFYAIPEGIAPFVMPFLNTVLFFGAAMIINLAVLCINKLQNHTRA